MTALSIDIWGPKAWGFLHACTFVYPDKPSQKDRTHMFNLLNSLGYVLPCTVCRRHFKEMFDETVHGPDSHVLDNRLQLSKWLVDVHNDVNLRNSKPQLSYEEVEQMYVKTASVCSASSQEKSRSQKLAESVRRACQYFTASLVTLLLCMLLSKFVFKCKTCTET